MPRFDRAAIAQRLREILMGIEKEMDLGALAGKLGIDEVSLRMSVDTLSPHPTIEVLGAVIRDYAVDPSWLLTGQYDPETHRVAIEGEPMDSRPVKEFIQQRPMRISEPTPESVRAIELN